MRFAVVGGDRRTAKLAELLLRDGHKVHSFALEKAALPQEIPRDGCLQSCVYAADCVLLPVPAEKGGWTMTFEPITDNAAGSDPADIMKTYYQLLQRDIEAVPWNYLWTHKRWKED